MEKEQQLEWAEAQKIVISENLVAAAKRQLCFLAAVDRIRWLYEGQTLLKAIYRYNAFWLPLLAKHHEVRQTQGPLVVPLDCEWIWHCHRLNPIRYKMDCQKLYGKLLSNSEVVSCTEGALKTETEGVWKRIFPDEPYELDLTSVDISETDLKAENFTDYDLVSAVQRQSPFYYQVSRQYVNTDLFLEEALARYKGFLHMIRRNRERSIRRFCVPTYDIDLIWHTHQLHPVSYGKDMMELLGKILEHDDMDSDRSKGAKLDVGFSGTTKQWEESFGTRYWRAGAMYRGSAPSPVTKTPYPFKSLGNKVVFLDEGNKILQLPELKYVEVLLEIVDVMNVPDGLKGSPYVSFIKKQPDAFFTARRNLHISSKAGAKEVTSFQCEPNGELHFELMYHKHSHLPLSKQCKPLGSASFSISEFLAKGSALSVEKWFEMAPSSANDSVKPLSLRIALSFTLSTPAPYVFQMGHPGSFLRNSCFFPVSGRVKQSKSWTPVIGDDGKEILSLQMRKSTNGKEGNNAASKEVLGVTQSGNVQSLARQIGSTWLSADSHWSLKKSDNSAYLFDVVGTIAVRLYSGRKLECQPAHCAKKRREVDFITVVEFSTENPYGTAVALLDLKSGSITVKEEWFVVPGITLGFIVAEMLKKEGYDGLIAGEGNSVETVYDASLAADGLCLESAKADLLHTLGGEGNLSQGPTGVETVMLDKEIVNSDGCGAGCGGACGSMVNSGGCGGCGGGCGGCGGGLGNKTASDGHETMVSSGGCGGCGGGCGGCGGGLGNKTASDGNGTFCGGSGGCGGCGGRGFGNTGKTAGGCGGCGGSGGCGGACGVNSTHQMSAAPSCNPGTSQQVAVDAH